MRIALFTDADGFAGTERHMLDLAEGLKREGVAVSLACPHGSVLASHAMAGAIPLVLVEKQGRIDIAAVRRLASLLSRGEIDLLHAHNGRTAFISALAIKLARRGRAVSTQHFISPARAHRRGPSAAGSRLVHRWISKRVAHFITVSEAARGAMIERAESPEKITVIPNGIADPDRMQLAPSEIIRKQYGIPPYAPLIACVARLEREKDIATLVRAMVHVRATRPDAVCVIAGDGSLRDLIARQIRDAALGDSVHLAGFLPDTLSLINAGVLFVLPSLAEPFGLVLLEAMSLAKPVIATRAGGPLEIVEPGLTGLLVEPGNDMELAGAIVRLLSDPAALEEFGSRGRKRFLERFTDKRMSQATLEVYQQVLGSQ